MDRQTDRKISDSRKTKTNVQLLICTFRCSCAVMVLNACRIVRSYLLIWNCLNANWCVICLLLSGLVNPSHVEILFDRRQDLCDARLQPDRVSFSSACAACQRTAAVDQAWQLLKQLPMHSLSHWAPTNGAWKRVAHGTVWWTCVKMFEFLGIEQKIGAKTKHSLELACQYSHP